MEIAKAQVLFDIGLLTLGAMALGLLVFSLVRKHDREVGWHHHGNVWTDPYDRIDLLAAWTLIVFFFGQVALLLFALKAGFSTETATEGTAEKLLDLPTILAGTAFNLILGGGVFAFATLGRDRNPVELFGLDRISLPKLIFWSIGALIVTYGIMAILLLRIWEPFFAPLWGAEDDRQLVVKTMMDDPSPLLRIVLILSAVVVAPLVEEVIFRGYLYAVIKRFSDRFLAAVTTSLLFALIHGNIPGLLPLFGLAIVLCIAYEMTGSLWVPISIHALFNSVNTAMMLFGPSLENAP